MDSPPPLDGPADRPRRLANLTKLAHAAANWFWLNAAILAFGTWLVGRIFRDDYRVTAFLFFVPTVLIALALVLTALLAWATRCRLAAVLAGLLSLGPLIATGFVENHWLRPRPTGDPANALRLVHWNVNACEQGWQAILGTLKEHEADLYFLAEIYGDRDLSGIKAGLGTGFNLVHVRQFGIFSRDPIKIVKTDERIPQKAYFLRWESKAGPILLLLVDLPSGPPYYRGPWLRRVDETILATEPDVILGDFNASRRVRGLSRLPEGYAHAYYLAGAGWSGTFTDSLPLWDFDQCIVGPRIRPIRYDIVTTGTSDHRLQSLEFSLASPPTGDP